MRAISVIACLVIGSAAHAEKPSAALLTAWADAQNRGDFDAYEKLYAKSFRGIRRSGKTVRTLDRAAWMKERARMFRAPLDVEVSYAVLGDLELKFLHTWSDGAWADEGTKVLTLVEEGGALRIAREELLSSKRIPVALAPLDGDDWKALRGGMAAALRGTRLLLVDRRGTKAKQVAEQELSTGAPIESLARHERTLSDEAATLLPGYAAIAVRTAVHEKDEDTGREWLDSDLLTLYLWRGDKLTPVFSVLLHDDTSSPDCGAGSKATVAAGPPERGFPTIVVTTEHSGENVAHCRAENGTKVTRAAWDGARFVEE